MDFKNKRIAVVGLGKSGFAAAKFLAKKKAFLAVTDGLIRQDFGTGIAAIALEMPSSFTGPTPVTSSISVSSRGRRRAMSRSVASLKTT